MNSIFNVHFFLHKGRYHVDNNNGFCFIYGEWRMERERCHCYKTYGLPFGLYTSSPTIFGPPALGPANPSSNYRTQASIAGKAISLSFLFCLLSVSVKNGISEGNVHHEPVGRSDNRRNSCTRYT